MFTRPFANLHRDQDGTISIVSVFAVLALTMLLGMVLNAGRHVDGKLRMQNAADAAAYSGGVVIARGMNTLAFTNHLLCDVFAVTAFLREGRDGNAATYAPQILTAWDHVAQQFRKASFAKFAQLGAAIPQKTGMEQQMVDAYSAWARAVSERVLPEMEAILSGELIPRYQQAVVAAFPAIAQAAVFEVARRNGVPDYGRGQMLGAFWRTTGALVGGGEEGYDPSLPTYDPNEGGDAPQRLIDLARTQRKTLATNYLNQWNNEAMQGFDRWAKMSQFSGMWRSFTCGQLKKLLEDEYPNRNLPIQIRPPGDEGVTSNEVIERQYMFVGVVYWRQLPEMMPGLFRNPTDADALAYAQVQVFVPRWRLIWVATRGGGGGGNSGMAIGGVPGEFPTLGGDTTTTTGGGGGGTQWKVGRQGVPMHWDLLNQHWTCQIVPATGPNLATILQTMPPRPEFAAAGIRLPNLGGLSNNDIKTVSPH